jgi:hypothetical protein
MKDAKKKIPKYRCQWVKPESGREKFIFGGKCVKKECPLLFRSYPIVYEFGVLILTLAYFVGFGIDDLTDHIEAAHKAAKRSEVEMAIRQSDEEYLAGVDVKALKDVAAACGVDLTECIDYVDDRWLVDDLTKKADIVNRIRAALEAAKRSETSVQDGTQVDDSQQRADVGHFELAQRPDQATPAASARAGGTEQATPAAPAPASPPEPAAVGS